MPNGCENDHDRIIRIDSNLTQIGKEITEIKEFMKSSNNELDKKLDKKSYYVHMVILIGTISGIIGFVASHVFC